MKKYRQGETPSRPRQTGGPLHEALRWVMLPTHRSGLPSSLGMVWWTTEASSQRVG